jgi:hypothetical protein
MPFLADRRKLTADGYFPLPPSVLSVPSVISVVKLPFFVSSVSSW